MRTRNMTAWTFALLMSCSMASAADRTWSGPSGGDWFVKENWTPSDAYPQPGESVLITNGSVLLTNSTAMLGDLTVSNAVLTFTNWTTVLCATNVGIHSGGVLNHVPGSTNAPALTSNRVHIVCSDFAINAGGVIDVDGAGYPGGDTSGHLAGYGPGAGPSYRGAGHGGVGGDGGGGTYGSTNAPTAPGSGGGGYSSPASHGGAGGGAVRLDVSGHAVVNGTISADGVAGTGATVFSGGSGGSLYLSCATFAGTGGVMRANGGGAAAQSYMRTGGGGRIAVVASDAIAQNALPVPSVSFSAGREETGNASPSYLGDIGTVYLLYERWLPDVTTPAYNGRFGGFSSWTRDSLTVSNGWIGTLESGGQVSVTNDLRVLGSEGRFDLVNATVTVGGSVLLDAGALYLYGEGTNGSSLSCGTDLALTNGALFRVDAGVTNDVATNFGSRVSVPGLMVVGGNCTVSPYSHSTNGGSVLFSVGELFVAANGRITADEAGFSGAMTAGTEGFGPGRGQIYCGGGYGGGGAGSGGSGNGAVYGNSNAPVLPGSGGGSYQDYGGRGGGLVRIEAAGTITVNGTISADGQDAHYGDGAGSGGGVYLICDIFDGAAGGMLRADGGDTWRTGGGGRIAVWRFSDLSAGAVAASANNGTGGQNESPTSTVGTVVWGTRQAANIVSLNVESDSVEVGNPSPHDYATYAVSQNGTVIESVTTPAEQADGARYVCVGWRMTNELGGSAGDTNSEASFVVATNSTLTWQWQREYHLTTTAGANGSLQVDRTGWYASTSQVSVTAVGAGGYHFLQWSGVPPEMISSNPLTVATDQPRTIKANFANDTPTTREWNGVGNWFSDTNWSSPLGLGIPGTGDTVVVRSGVSTLGEPVAVADLVVSNGATLCFSNWTTYVSAPSLRILSGGTVTHAPCDTNGATLTSNRVHIVCSDFVIEANGAIDVDAAGYSGGDSSGHMTGYGPGGGLAYRGAGHGGRGGGSGGGAVYGSATAPTAPGSGGGGYGDIYPNRGGWGGGAVRLDVSGHAVVNGTISANGVAATGPSLLFSAGSGGSIYLTCDTFSGTGGVLRANGGGDATEGTLRSGGGGRIAVVAANTAAQEALPVPSVSFSAGRGVTGNASPSYRGDIGTVYLLYERWLPDFLTPDYNGRFGGFSAWTRDSLTVSNGWIGTLEDGGSMTVTNDLRVLGTEGRLDLSNATVTVAGSVVLNAGSLYLYGGGTNGSSLSCGADLTLTDGAAFRIDAGVTNSGTGDFGSRVSVPSLMYVGGNCTVSPYSHATNGGSVLFSVGELFLAANGQMNADAAGFSGAMTANSEGFGPGRGQIYCGGGYGGGGAGSGGSGNGATYGSSNAPVHPGSGGGSYTSYGGRGGGLVRVEAAGTITVNGTISVDGQLPPGGAGAGSGGGIYLTSHTFSGAASGLLQANGGNTWRTGGGGRIAVWRTKDTSEGVVSTSVNPGTGGQGEDPTSSEGTVVWGQRQAGGTVFLLR